jgi:hypothetical protein
VLVKVKVQLPISPPVMVPKSMVLSLNWISGPTPAYAMAAIPKMIVVRVVFFMSYYTPFRFCLAKNPFNPHAAVKFQHFAKRGLEIINNFLEGRAFQSLSNAGECFGPTEHVFEIVDHVLDAAVNLLSIFLSLSIQDQRRTPVSSMMASLFDRFDSNKRQHVLPVAHQLGAGEAFLACPSAR